VKGALLALAVCVVLVLGGCGGSDSASTSSTVSTSAEVTTAPQASKQDTTPTAPEKGRQDEGKSGGSSAKEGDEGNNNSSSSKKPPKPVKPPAISSRPIAGSKHPAPGVKTVKGGDNSVQEYGVEANGSERREASIALATYLNARAEGNWAGACSLLAPRPTEQLERLSGHKADCAEVLAATAKGTSSQPGSVITEVLSFRGEGDISGNPSYLIFTGPPGNTLFSMPMYSQGGTWKVGLAQPSELPVG
jgi:hypothetical protein